MNDIAAPGGNGAASQISTVPSPPKNDVTLTINGTSFGGWQAIRITRGIERMPGDFDIVATEMYPNQPSRIDLQPGQSCVVKIGADTVITGYVDRYIPSIGPKVHTVRIQGRGKCQDLVDCSAGFKPDGTFAMGVNVVSALKLAQDLAAPFGITATCDVTEAGTPIPQINVLIGETPFEIIDRVTRYRQLLAYEGADGNLILAQAGTTTMASGFAVPGNIEQASVSFGMDQRFSDYHVTWTSTDSLTQQLAEAVGGPNGNHHGHVKDGAMPRFRPRGIVSEQMPSGVDIGNRRAAWEMNRRNGRSQTISLTCDSWRDSAGTLWMPNALARVDVPIMKLVNQFWIISEVTYRRDDDGTHADLVLMPPGAFQPGPTALLGYNWQIGQDLGNTAGAATAGPGGLRGSV